MKVIVMILQSSDDGASLLMDTTLCSRFKVYNGVKQKLPNNADCVH